MYENLIIDIPFKQYTGVYFLYQKEELVYVGVSGDIAVRLSQHKLGPYFKVWDCVKYIEELNYLECIRIENYFIDTYKPKYNRGPGKLKESIATYGINFDPLKLWRFEHQLE